MGDRGSDIIALEHLAQVLELPHGCDVEVVIGVDQMDDGWMVSLVRFFKPKCLGSWLTVAKMADPNTKPSLTGRLGYEVMNPRRSNRQQRR